MFSVGVECSRCGQAFPKDEALTLCTSCGGALLFRYDLASVAKRISKEVLDRREDAFWKFVELLPVSSTAGIVSLGEPYTPIIQLSGGHNTLFKNVYVKDEGRLPTGTFKARGMAVLVSRLRELGVKSVTLPSAGNAAAALAVYGAKAEMTIYAFMPKDVPDSILKECVFAGAIVYLVDGLISDAAAIVRRLAQKYGWFDVSTNRQPYRVEGYKAMAFEIADQFNWDVPDSILFPTGGGEGIIGLWKGFKELMELGWTKKIPHLIVVQSSGCAPIVEAYRNEELEVRKAWENADTIASGLRVPNPYASYLVLRAIRETGGTAVAVDDKEIVSSMKSLFRMGICACPEAATTLAALEKLGSDGILSYDETILLCLTGNAMKYLDSMGIEKDKIPVLRKGVGALP